MTTRRSFLTAMFAAASAPAIVSASSLMPVYVPRVLTLHGDLLHDDTRALQALLDGDAVMFRGVRFDPGQSGLVLPRGRFRISDSLNARGGLIGTDASLYMASGVRKPRVLAYGMEMW